MARRIWIGLDYDWTGLGWIWLDWNSPGHWPNGVLDLQQSGLGFWKMGRFPSPPPSQRTLGTKSPTFRGGRSTFERYFDWFFRVSIFDSFFDAILHRFWLPKWKQNRSKIWLFRRLSLEVFFSGLKSLLKLIFASTAGPANLDFCNTLHCFWKFFHFSEDRVENDFEVVFDLPKAPKNLPTSAKTGPRN